jgi:hypothetical protein
MDPSSDWQPEAGPSDSDSILKQFRRGVLCLGESTAESGPRCGEAEEAKRRPAFNLGRRGRPARDAFERPPRGAATALFPLTLGARFGTLSGSKSAFEIASAPGFAPEARPTARKISAEAS